MWAHVDGVDTATPQGQAVQCGLPVSLGFYTLYFAIVWRNLPVARAHTRVGACWSCLCSCCRLRHRGLLRCWCRCPQMVQRNHGVRGSCFSRRARACGQAGGRAGGLCGMGSHLSPEDGFMWYWIAKIECWYWKSLRLSCLGLCLQCDDVHVQHDHCFQHGLSTI